MTDDVAPLQTIAPPVAVAGTTVSPALSGAIGAGLAIGVTELLAGLFDGVPSAVASVGSFVVDAAPASVERFAIETFGTADKGALAIGTTILAVLIGALIGRFARSRRAVGIAGFAAFGVVGVFAGWAQPLVSDFSTLLAIGFAAFAGWKLMDWLLGHSRAVPVPTDGLVEDTSRRKFIAAATGAGVAAASGVTGRLLIIERSEQVRETIALPDAATVVAPVGPENQFAVDGLTPIVVPNSDFYRIDTALVVPRPDPNVWSLNVTGMVDNPISLSLDDLYGFTQHERYVTIACVSNQIGGRLVGNAKWSGVRLVDVLEMAGVQPRATQIVGRSVDGWTGGFPTELAFDGRDPLIALGMNDEPLPPDHGFPARLIVPGLYGYVSATKWIENIELTTWEGFDGYWIPRGWSKEGPIKTQSRIDRPHLGQRLEPGPNTIAGVAWAPLKGITRVEVRVDDEDAVGVWQEAELTTPLSDAAWVQWKLDVDLSGEKRYFVTVRATDGDGITQTAVESNVAPNGATGHHQIDFRTV